MSHDDLQRLPCFDFRAGEKGSRLCCFLENFKLGDKCKLLHCRYSFHANCVNSWLLKTPVCPICRISAETRKAGMVMGEESSHSIEVPSEFMETRPVEVGSRLSSNPPTLQASASEFEHTYRGLPLPQ